MGRRTEMGQLKEVGIIHFDVPDEIRLFAGRLRHRLRKGRALPASKSVYLFNWGDLLGLQQIVEDARESFREKYPDDAQKLGTLIVDFVKADDVTSEQAHEMAVRGLSNLIGQIHGSLKKQLDKAREEGESELPRRIQITFIHKMEEIEALGMAFRLMDDVGVALEAARKLVSAQIGKDVAEKFLAKERKEKKPKKETAATA